MVKSEASFTRICPSCLSRSFIGMSELRQFRARPGVIRWPCSVCLCMVEMATKEGIALKAPRKLKREEIAKLRGKGKRESGER